MWDDDSEESDLCEHCPEGDFDEKED